MGSLIMLACPVSWQDAHSLVIMMCWPHFIPLLCAYSTQQHISVSLLGLTQFYLQGRLLRELQNFVGAAQPSYLPAFAQRAQDFHDGVQSLVYDVLMLKVLLRNPHEAPFWHPYFRSLI